MTKTRVGDPFMSADEFGRSLPKFSTNLLVRNVETSLKFYREVLGATVRYSDNDFAALSLVGVDFMLHADHTYDHHPLYPHLMAAPVRGAGAEFRFLGIHPDKVEEGAKRIGTLIVQPAKDFRHGWREITVMDPGGYIWTVGLPIPAQM